MGVVWVLLGIGVLAAVAVAASGRWGGLPDVHPDRPDLALPDAGPVTRAAVDGLHFSVGWRGYRMDEVDDVLDRLALELSARDDRIRALEAARRVEPQPVEDHPRALLVPLLDPDAVRENVADDETPGG